MRKERSERTTLVTCSTHLRGSSVFVPHCHTSLTVSSLLHHHISATSLRLQIAQGPVSQFPSQSKTGQAKQQGGNRGKKRPQRAYQATAKASPDDESTRLHCEKDHDVSLICLNSSLSEIYILPRRSLTQAILIVEIQPPHIPDTRISSHLIYYCIYYTTLRIRAINQYRQHTLHSCLSTLIMQARSFSTFLPTLYFH